MGGERHIGEQLALEQPLALVDRGIGELPAGIGEADVAALDLGETQHLQRLGDREQVVDLHVQSEPRSRQVGLAVVGRRRPPPRSARTAGSADTCVSTVPMPRPGRARRGTRALRPAARSSRRRCARPSRGTAGPARLRGCGRSTLISLDDAAGIAREQQDAVAHQHRLLDVVGDQDHALDRHTGLRAHSSRKSVRSVSAVSTSSAENGSSISRMLGCTTSARAKPTRWRMPPDSSRG